MSSRTRILLLILVCVLPFFIWSLFLPTKPVAPRSNSPAPIVTITPSPPITPTTDSSGDILDGASTN